MKAQKARGADFETGGLVQKAKNLIPLLVPANNIAKTPNAIKSLEVNFKLSF